MSTVTPSTANAPASGAPAWSLEDMPLDRLREYRRHLQEEEIRTSFWRRIIQGRLDLLKEQQHFPIEPHRLARELRDADSPIPRRQAFLKISGDQEFPAIGNMEDLSEQSYSHLTPEQREVALAQLKAVEAKVSKYRAGIGRNLDATTRELVNRYRNNPELMKTALPASLFV